MTTPEAAPKGEDPWIRLRGVMKDIFSELGGGENYLLAERSDFQNDRDLK
ncbi:MAG: hypothetical protein WB711_19295 [Terriglobales bacterium]